ncbi:hypothetical protein FSP39_009621 [Pinctada imbricata]|uniref:Uncharacterized protein n=1 Tax=Pinctada imbricata TaxID=66713 RepID=A0AA88YPG2_PINIB|nr:hypothetical protein FSP39_009621 [Pinctada imbricata]
MDLSTRLSYLFGSEGYILMRRQLVLWRENLYNHLGREMQARIICSGSLGEGIVYPKSDDDLMFYMTHIRVVKTYREATQMFDLLMVPSDFSPGYCLLLDVKGLYSADYIYFMSNMPFLSSSLWKQIYLLEGEFVHGPCLSGSVGSDEFDFAISIQCYCWPDMANGWIHRDRVNAWPPYEILQSIVQNGCHVVPVGDPDSPYGQHEWRISFSVAERTLMHSLNHAQFLIYNLLRLSLKRIIGRIAPDVLCSYFMKTTLFYTSENTSIEFWRADNLETCFRLCLSVLYDYVDHKYCPNYFIPEYNMIKRKINQSNRHQMLDIIRYIHGIGILGVIHLSGESYCLDDILSARLMECKLDTVIIMSDHFQLVSIEINRFFERLPYGDFAHYLYPLCYFYDFLGGSSAIGDGLINILLYRGILHICQHMLHRLLISYELNKRNYHLYKGIQSLLRIAYKGDVTTGKLTMAMYMYMIGQTESALSIIRHLLSEYPPYVIDHSSNNIKKHTYMNVMCGRGYSIDYKIKRSYAPPYFLSDKYLNAVPYPMRIWISIMGVSPLDPLTYTYSLQCLCYVQERRGSPTTRGCSTHSKIPKHPCKKHRTDTHRKRRKRDKEHQLTT